MATGDRPDRWFRRRCNRVARPFNHPFHRLHQLVVDRAADATVAQLHHVFIGGDDEIVVDADFTELVHQHRGLQPLLIAQDVIQQRGFSRSKEAAENGDGDVGGGWCGGHAQGPTGLMLVAIASISFLFDVCLGDGAENSQSLERPSRYPATRPVAAP